MFDPSSAYKYVDKLGQLGSRPGLARIRKLCALLGDPQDDLSFIHIAGTNGKGSTGAFISSVLTASGVKTGMYYSPALSDISDHYMINGERISEEDYAYHVSKVAASNKKLIDETGESATQFEFETAVAFTLFRDNHCDAVILECGMGGRDDATNIVKNKICCVFASISFDHMQYLGDTLSKITDVKSGIITCACPVIAFDSSNESTEVIRKRCEETGSDLYLVKPDDIISAAIRPFGRMVSYDGFSDIETGLSGTFQSENAALALKTISVIRDNFLIDNANITDDVIRKGMKTAKWPFRFERISEEPLIIVDGAHNADAAKKLADSIREYLSDYEIILVIGMFADKEYDKVASILAPLATNVYTVRIPDNPRALPPEELAKCISKYNKRVKAYKYITEVCQRTAKELTEDHGGRSGEKPRMILACGSMSYLYIFKDYIKDYI